MWKLALTETQFL